MVVSCLRSAHFPGIRCQQERADRADREPSFGIGAERVQHQSDREYTRIAYICVEKLYLHNRENFPILIVPIITPLHAHQKKIYVFNKDVVIFANKLRELENNNR